MNIIQIKIDGYKNIKNTAIRFNEPLVLLLSRNNYGKTNILTAIRDGLAFIRKESGNSHFFKEPNRTPFKKLFCDQDYEFAFEVMFSVDESCSNTYRYGYSLQPVGERGDFAVKNEYLYLAERTNEQERLLFEREKSSEANEQGADIGHDTDDDKKMSRILTNRQLIPATLYLSIFGNFSDNIKGAEWTGYEDTLKRINEAYTNLITRDLGEILIDERSRFEKEHLQAVVSGIEDIKLMTPDDFCKFEQYFLQLFPDFDEMIIDNPSELLPRLYLRRKIDNKQIPIELQSFGTRRILTLLFLLFDNKIPLVSIEELEIGMHPKLFTDLLQIITDIVNSNAQRKGFSSSKVIVSTHSHVLANHMGDHLDSIYFGVAGYVEEASKGTTSRFVGFTESGKDAIYKTLEDLGGYFGIAEIIFDYDDNPDKKHILRSWLEDYEDRVITNDYDDPDYRESLNQWLDEGGV